MGYLGAGALSRRPAVDGAVIPEPGQPSLWKRHQRQWPWETSLCQAGNTLETRAFLQGLQESQWFCREGRSEFQVVSWELAHSNEAGEAAESLTDVS